jgi:hypothetical protein
VAAIGTALVLRLAPELFLNFPRSNPLLWSLVMVLYPVLSVYPQGIIYRAFLFGRYRDLFGSGYAMVLASAIWFAYVHIVFRNPLALGLSSWPACFSRPGTGSRARCSSPHSNRRSTNARSSPSGWGVGFISAAARR